jgi:hypothetical protein
MSVVPVKPASPPYLQAIACAALLAAAAGAYLLAREYTDWSPATAMMAAIGAGAFAYVAAGLALLTLRFQLISRGVPSFLTRDVQQARDEYLVQMAADRKELGLDKESKAFAEQNVQELDRLLRELETSPQYMKAGEAERQKLTDELAARHFRESEARVSEVSAHAVERLEALRDYRALEARARRGESLPLEEKARMKRLKTKAYSGKLR